jgi:hypothetical protein
MTEARKSSFQPPRSVKQLRTSEAVKAYQKEWFQKIKEGQYGICNADEAEEIFIALGMPAVVIQWWSGIIAAKRLSAHYGNLLAKRGWDFDQYGSLGLGCTLDNNPETAPWGGLPRPAVITGLSPAQEVWAREWGCPHFPLDRGTRVNMGSYPRMWETLRDHWDEMIEPHLLDFRVEQEKALIRFLENTTGRRCSMERLNEVLELINEQEDYWRKARDLIAETIPCPVGLPDQLSIYPAQWFRGTPEARDLLKAYYEEVKERVDKHEAACPNEKIRLMWMGAGLWTNTAFYQYFEKEYGATFVCSIYTSIAADFYARTTHNNDPLRTVAGRHILLGFGGAEWMVKEAKLHKCDGVVGFGSGSASAVGTRPFEEAGIPAIEIPGHNVDARQWDDEKVRSIVSNFLEKRILSKKVVQ